MDLRIFLLDEKYLNQTKSKNKNVMYTVPNNDGLIDSIPIAFKSFSIFCVLYCMLLMIET